MKEQSFLCIIPLGMALGILIASSFMICVIFGVLFPSMTMYQAWLPLLPGVTWISWQSVLIGIAESFAYGWYVALIFVPTYNLFLKRRPT